MFEHGLAKPSRRSFLASLPFIAGAVGFTKPAARVSAKWDLRWLDDLKGKHKQVFGFGELRGGIGLDIVTNWLDAHKEVYSLEYPHINALIGIANKSYPLNATDAMWAKYELGKRYEVIDPQTNAPAVRNVFVEARKNGLGKMVGIELLKSRGAIFWQCNNALTGVAGVLARATNQEHAVVKEELIANLLPAVKLVPAHTMLLGLAQEHGCTYEAI